MRYFMSLERRGVQCAPVPCHPVGYGLPDVPYVFRFFAAGGRDDLPYENDNTAWFAMAAVGVCGSTLCSPTVATVGVPVSSAVRQ